MLEDEQASLFDNQVIPDNKFQEEEVKNIDEIIDDLGFHLYNTSMLILESMVLFCDGIEIYTVILLLPVIEKRYNLNYIENSLAICTTFLGAALGVLMSSYLTNKFGERKPFLVVVFVIAVFGTISVVIDNFIWFVFCRFVIGLSIGISVNYVNCLFENLPSKSRGIVSIVIFVGVDLGIVFYCLLFYLYTINQSPDDVYQIVVIVSTIPMYLCLLLSFFFFQESPRKLLWNKEFDKLFGILDKYSGKTNYLSEAQKEKLKSIVDTHNRHKEIDDSTYFSKLRVAFKDNSKNILLLISVWTIGFGIYYNAAYLLPKYYDSEITKSEKNDIDYFYIQTNSAKMLKLVWVNLSIATGNFVCGFFALFDWNRKLIIAIGFVITAVFSSMKFIDIGHIEYYTIIMKISSKLAINYGRLFTSECFHTDLREVVYSLCGFVSRLFLVFVPFIFEFLFNLNPYLAIYYEVVLSGLGLIAILLVTINPDIKEIDKTKNSKGPIAIGH